MYGAMMRETMDVSLISMFIEGPDVSLNGSPTVSPVTAALWASEPFLYLAVYLYAFLERFFRIVPGASGVGLEYSHQYAGNCDTRKHSSEDFRAEYETYQHGRYQRDSSGKHHLADGGVCGYGYAFFIFRFGFVFHDAGNLAELAADFIYHVHRCAAYGGDSQRGENERYHGSYEQTGQNVGMIYVDACYARNAHECGEQSQ